MKSIKLSIILGLILCSFNGFASSGLLLDASCKANCLISIEEVDADQGGVFYNRVYKTVHFDFLGLTRKEIENKTTGKALELICKNAFGTHLGGTLSECLYFKH